MCRLRRRSPGPVPAGSSLASGVMVCVLPSLCRTGPLPQASRYLRSYSFHCVSFLTESSSYLGQCFDLLLGGVDGEVVIVLVVAVNSVCGYQKFFGVQPAAGIDHGVLNGAGCVIEDHVLDGAEFVVVAAVKIGSANVVNIAGKAIVA